MKRFHEQSALLRLIYVLVVICVFVKNIGANVEFNRSENDENPEHSVFYEAAKLTQSLASRNHTIIATVSDVLMTEDQLKNEIDDLYRDRARYVERISDDFKRSLSERTQSTNEFSTSNELAINSIFDRTLGNDEISADQLIAQIIRHQLNAPIKVIQSLLSVAITELSPSTGSNSNQTQLFQRIVEQFKYKPRVIKEVAVDLDSFLKENSNYFFLKPTLDALQHLADEILASNRIPAENVTKSLSNEWKYLTTIVIITYDEPHLAKELQNLTRCPELGIAAYKDCRQNSTKLATFSVQVDKFQAELKKWNQFEQTIYDAVYPVLMEIQKSLDDEHAAKFNGHILPILQELDAVLTEMQEHPMHSDELSRATEDTRQLIRMIISLNNHIEVSADKEALAVALQKIEKIGPELPRKMKMLNGIITANLMLEMCKTTNEMLKMRVIPFDQDHLQLCDMPSISESSEAEQHVKQNLLENIQGLRRKIRYNRAVSRRVDSLIMINIYMESSPLYVWKYADFKDEITKLLSGEKVTLNANILNSFSHDRFGVENGIRFSKISLMFKFADKSRQYAFNKTINGIGVEMSTIGNNYFRCDDRIYYVPTDASTMLRYRIKSDRYMDITEPNGMYPAVLAREDYPFLSPYNVWQMQLDSSELQAELTEYIGEEIDLHLIGEWRHVRNKSYGKDVCHNSDLDKNYHLDRILKS